MVYAIISRHDLVILVILCSTPQFCIVPLNLLELEYIYIYIYIYIYGIHHRRILWSSCRKLARVGSEPTTTEFRSDALTDWAIRPWVQLALRANFVQLLQFHRLFSVTFHFGYCLCQSPRFFYNLSGIYI